MSRKMELFSLNDIHHKSTISVSGLKLYPQERDWTCSIACIRSILYAIDNKVINEDEYIEKYNLIPRAYYSKDIKALGVLTNYDVIYGCDTPSITFDDLLEYLLNQHFVMVESMYNYSHWYVLLGYYPLINDNIEKSKILIYDPYYDETNLLNTDEFLGMWVDGEYLKNGIKKDFIAIRKKLL